MARNTSGMNYETGIAWQRMSDETVEALIEFAIDKFGRGLGLERTRELVNGFVSEIFDGMIDRGDLDWYPGGEGEEPFDVFKLETALVTRKIISHMGDELNMSELNLEGLADGEDVLQAFEKVFPEGNPAIASNGLAVSVSVPILEDYGYDLPEGTEPSEDDIAETREMLGDAFNEMIKQLDAEGWIGTSGLTPDYQDLSKYGINRMMLDVLLYA